MDPLPVEFQSGPHSEAAHASILTEALAAVYGERQASYGHPRVNFKRIADLWNGYLDAICADGSGRSVLGTTDVAAMFVLVKMARLMETPTHRDSWVDIAGYAEAGARAVGVDE